MVALGNPRLCLGGQDLAPTRPQDGGGEIKLRKPLHRVSRGLPPHEASPHREEREDRVVIDGHVPEEQEGTKAVVREIGGVDAIQIRPLAYVSLTIDHRVVDGHQTNAWLTRFVEVLENWPKE